MFIHLRVHSAYSLLEGALRLDRIVDLAKNDRQPAVCVSDTANLFGALEFSEAAFKQGVQPIIGCTAPIQLASRQRQGRTIAPVARLPLIAATSEGFDNLAKLISHAYLASDGETVALSLGDIAASSAGIIALTGWLDGPLGIAMTEGNEEEFSSLATELHGTFGDRLYCEVQRHGRPEDTTLEAVVRQLAIDLELPLVATNEAYFENEADYEAHDALLAIAESRRVADDDRRRLTATHNFASQADMMARFADLPEAIESTVEIAMRVSHRPRKCPPLLPSFLATGESQSAEERLAAETQSLHDMARAGLEERLATRGLAPGVERAVYDARLEHELSIIASMKFPGYFLIVADFIQWAKAQDIAVGPGRGSGAGSLVAYSLLITDLDPLRFDLLFERFLNPERISMPDFDIDFCQERRDEVIQYVQTRYGADRVAQIITVGTLQARAVVRDVGRVLDMPYGKVDQLAKLVPSNPANPVKLGQAIDQEPRLQDARASDEQTAQLLSIALKLEGLFRHASTHAAGIVNRDRALEEIVPLYRDPRSSMPVTQYNMKWVENAGLVKFDFLGLKTLTTIERALALISDPPDFETLPLDDRASYQLLTSGDTLGVFQLESAGMRRALVGMKPDRFEDIIAIVALYRPGPMDNIPAYNRRKHGQEEPDYLHDKLKEILQETHGIIIYQEQVMQIAQVLSGYTLGEADMLRRAMGKKIAAEMAVQRDRFVDGAVERGTAKAEASHIFDLVAKFANYGFNKSHAAAYALVAYQTAYLKANHPREFLAASMTLDMGNTDKLAEFRAEALRMDIEVLRPCVNRSLLEFNVVNGAIDYGLAAIKGVGRPLVAHIVAERDKQPFASITDFANRLDPKIAPRRGLEALIAAGAFDNLVDNRGALIGAIDHILGVAQRISNGDAIGQSDFFGAAKDDDIRLPENAAWTPAERLQKEFEAIGFYLSSHPLDDYRQAMAERRIPLWRDFESAFRRGEGHRIAGAVMARQERRTRTGGRIGVIQLSDPSGQYEAVAFSEILEHHRTLLEPGSCVLLTVQTQERDDGLSLRINGVEPLSNIANDRTSCTIFLAGDGSLPAISRLIADQGQCQVNFVAISASGRGNHETLVSLNDRRAVSPSVVAAIKSMAGVVDVKLTRGAAASP